ncbi:uncharacterized protein ACIGJ3_013736 [Trichechus inunguis]
MAKQESKRASHTSLESFRNGNPYFPYYSLALSEYPGFLVPQSLVPTRVNRRPPFPVYHHTTQFWHYNGLGKKMKTKETQTDPQKPENKCNKQDIHSETNSHEIDSVASVLTTTIETETGNAPEKTSGALSSVAQERELHHNSSWNTTPYRNTPTGSYAFEKEDVRTDYGNGFPARQSSETFKEAILLHDLAYGKAMPEDRVQHNLISGESMAGVHCNPPEGEDDIIYTDEQRAAVLSEQCPEGVRDKESGSGLEMSLDKEKKGYRAVSRILSPPVKVEAADDGQSIESQNIPRPEVCKSTEDVNDFQQGSPLCSSKKPINDLSLQSNAQNPLSDGERVLDISFVSPETVPLSLPSWLAQCKYVDEAISCDMSQFSWNNPPTSSEKMSNQETLLNEELEAAYYKDFDKFTECLHHQRV